jgi:mevalonate kinase
VYKASAPGRVSLLGEHAVLYDYPTLVVAVNQRLSVTLTPRADRRIVIHSALGAYESDLTQIEIAKPFQFILTAIKQWQTHFKMGATFTIEADFTDQMGLGSSAAATVATLSVLNAWLNLNNSNEKLIEIGIDIIRAVQGLGSGADIAASVSGGVIYFKKNPLLIEPLSFSHPLTVIYTGSKTPTVDVVQAVNHAFKNKSAQFKKIIQNIGEGALEGKQAIDQSDWKRVGQLMDQQQECMQQLGVSTPLMTTLIQLVRKEPAVLGVKISGAGLGDCIIALGSMEDTILMPYQKYGVKKIPLTIETRGVSCEKI